MTHPIDHHDGGDLENVDGPHVCSACGRRLVYLGGTMRRWVHVLGSAGSGVPWDHDALPVPVPERRADDADTWSDSELRMAWGDR